MEAIQIVECLKCSHHYFEQDIRVDTCSNCGNDNPQETIFLEPTGDMYWDVLKELRNKLLNVIKQGEHKDDNS